MSSDQKADLLAYLQMGRDTLLWKLDGLSEYDARRPLTPTGTNLLGLVKHSAHCEIGYFGDTFGRPYPVQALDYDADPNADMYATADESRTDIIDLYRAVWAHSNETVNTHALDAVGRVPFWPAERADATLHQLLIHMATETHRHAGHADILRELLDGAVGLRQSRSNMASDDPAFWVDYRDKLAKLAKEADQG
ncbi:DinB family protein [Actinokineospora inagensis]|uniref:DinB family protein n=1 Tax=Actinokineospora inagensis TaxID=103730 RepID=UPI000419605D|nr:DinB family protein [Actinokineospora inagensis]